MFLQFLFTGSSIATEKTAVWFVLFLTIGIVAQWIELSRSDTTRLRIPWTQKIMRSIASLVYKILGPKLSFKIAMHPIGRSFFKIFIHPHKKDVIFSTKYSFTMQMSIYEYFMSGYFFLGETNPFETQAVRDNLSDGTTFIDIGAHIGWYSLVAADKIGKSGKVIAFEPNPACITALKKNLNHNVDLSNIVLETKALSDKKGKTIFWIGDDMGGSFIRENTKRLTQNGKLKSIQVNTITLDEYLTEKKLTKINLIKIDVEGAEMQVLKGADKTLNKYSPDILIEVVNDTLQKNNFSKKELFSYLKEKKYNAYIPTASGLLPYKEQLGRDAMNIYFSKK
jgi:FkbM family methyltransferase